MDEVLGTHRPTSRASQLKLSGISTRSCRVILSGDQELRGASGSVAEIEHSALLKRLDAEETRMRLLVDDVLDEQPDAVIPWTGRHMAVAKFIPHLRNEHALHRWDIAGDDEVSGELLGRMDLVIIRWASSARSC